MTYHETPFCLLGYNVEIKLGGNSSALEGHFEILVIDESNLFTNLSSQIEETAKETIRETFYAHLPKVGKIKEAKVKWTEKAEEKKIIPTNPAQISIKIIKIAASSAPDQINFLCPYKHEQIKSNCYLHFKMCSEEEINKINEETTKENNTSSESEHKDANKTEQESDEDANKTEQESQEKTTEEEKEKTAEEEANYIKPTTSKHLKTTVEKNSYEKNEKNTEVECISKDIIPRGATDNTNNAITMQESLQSNIDKSIPLNKKRKRNKINRKRKNTTAITKKTIDCDSTTKQTTTSFQATNTTLINDNTSISNNQTVEETLIKPDDSTNSNEAFTTVANVNVTVATSNLTTAMDNTTMDTECLKRTIVN